MFRALTSRLSAPALSRAQLFTSTRSLTTIPKTRRFVFNKFEQHMRTISTTTLKVGATSSPSCSASTTPETPPTSVSDIVNRYGGWYPLIGLGGFFAVSKEYLILNEELLLATNFAAMVFIMWLAVGDSVHNAIVEEGQAIKKKSDEICELEADVYKSAIRSHQVNIDSLDVLKQLKIEYSTLVAAAIKAKDLKARQAAREAVLAKLNSIQSKEETELASHLDEVYDRTTAYVKRSFAAVSPAEKASLIDHAIAVAGGSTQPLDANTDPLKKLYTTYLNGKLYEKEIEADKLAKKTKQNAQH